MPVVVPSWHLPIPFPLSLILIIFNPSHFTLSYPLQRFWRLSKNLQRIRSPRFQSKISTGVTLMYNENNVVEQEEDPLVQLGLPSPLLLGSASFTRKLILKEMGIPFHKLVRPIDEQSLGDRSKDTPDHLVLTLAQAKMKHLLHEIQSGNCQDDLPPLISSKTHAEPELLVLTGDQVVTCNGQILEKPASIDEAKDFCDRYGRFPPSTVGSCVIHHMPSNIQVSGVDTATIYFKPTISGGRLIDKLLADEEPIMSCAGGLMIEHPLTKEHVERIDGTEDSVMGLSKDLVLRLLNELSQKVQAWSVEKNNSST